MTNPGEWSFGVIDTGIISDVLHMHAIIIIIPYLAHVSDLFIHLVAIACA